MNNSILEANKMGRSCSSPPPPPQQLPFSVTEYVTSRLYHVYLVEAIDSPDRYVKLFELLRSTSPNDVVRLHINCVGGNVITGMQLIQAMRECPARIITVLEGIAMSLAPLILFSGDEIEIPDNAIIMFHDFSQSQGHTKGNEIFKGIQAWRDMYKEMLMENASPILTSEEIDDIVDGRDKHFTGREINARLKALIDAKAKVEEIKAKPSTRKKRTVKKKPTTRKRKN